MPKSTPKEPTDREIAELARKGGKIRDGELELDDAPRVSRSSENGAYIQTWLWVSFNGTPFDKDEDDV